MGYLPAALRPAWSGASFLLYAGAFTVLVSLAVLFGTIASDHGSTALLGWSALIFLVLLAAAGASERAGRAVTAGLTAFVAIVSFAVVLGSLFDSIGLADGATLFDRDLELGPLVGEIAVLVAALAAARRWRFPLLLAAASLAKIVLVLDTTAGLFGLGNWIAVAALLLGLIELGVALSLDGAGKDPWAFWKHVSASLLIGGAVVWFLDGGDFGWILIGVVALLYVLMAGSLSRAAWAVVGAFGLLLVTSHFVDETDVIPGGLSIFGQSSNGDDGLEVWQIALVYAGLGIVYVLLGQLLRQPVTHEEPPPPG
jgi:hypothetical protein